MIKVHAESIRRLWPLIVVAPLIAACTGDYAYDPRPPGDVVYESSIQWMPPRPLAAPPTRFIPQASQVDSEPVSLPPSDNVEIVSQSTPAPPKGAGGNRPAPASPLPAVADRPPEPPPPEQHKPPPETQAASTRPSPTCGYWRLGCGILWP